jgi:glycosyltransferase involved in cell wall biosynthesis
MSAALKAIASSNVLIVIPSVRFSRQGDLLFLDIKAVEGLRLYAKLWPGLVRCLLRSGPTSSIGYGKLYHPSELPFEVHEIHDDISKSKQLLDKSAVILASGDNFHDLPIYKTTKTPVVFVIEYDLNTRLKIIDLETTGTFKKLKSAVWNLKTEFIRRRAFRHAAGLQANGTPAHNLYGPSTKSSLLYFDSRITETDAVSLNEISEKKASVLRGAPLRLAFSGRLIAMKGADHLVPIALALANRGVKFTLDIYGHGPLSESIRSSIQSSGMEDIITLAGPVPFAEELVPNLKSGVDIFLCAHTQADPSCTYLETMGCGVPIVGYNNDAFTGVLALGGGGLASPMGKPEEIAEAIVELDHDRVRLASLIDEAAALSSNHTFEKTFACRINHLRSIAGI